MATAELDIKVDASDIPNATKQLQQLQQQGAATEKSMAGVQKASTNMKGVMQGLSWQVQDVAVQLQMGTSAMTVLTQQGSQIASVFGPGGAAVGALLAVGGMLVSMASGSGQASDSLDDLVKKMDELSRSQLASTLDQLRLKQVDLEKAQQEALATLERTKIAQQQAGLTTGVFSTKLRELEANFDAASDAVNQNLQLMDLFDARLNGTTKTMEEQRKATAAIVSDYKFMTEALSMTAAEQDAYSKMRQEGIDANSEEGKAILSSSQAYHTKVDAIKAVEQAQKDAERAATKAQQEAERAAEKAKREDETKAQRAQAWLDKVEEYGKSEYEKIGIWQERELEQLRTHLDNKKITQQEAEDAYSAISAEAAEKRIQLAEQVQQKEEERTRLRVNAEKQATTQMAEMQWGLASQSLDAISMAAEEGSTLQKAAFLAGKGMAAAQAIMQAELASISTLAAYAAAAAAAGAGGPALLAAGQVQAANMKMMGYASAGVIMAQGFAGAFDNGGNIPSGQWGIVGERGPEIVQGPANVTSRKKTAALAASAASGGDGGAVYNFNISQTISGSGDEALAKVVDQATKNAVNEVQRDFAQNGRLRKTLGA